MSITNLWFVIISTISLIFISPAPEYALRTKEWNIFVNFMLRVVHLTRFAVDAHVHD